MSQKQIAYDTRSIMHYGGDFYQKNPIVNTITYKTGPLRGKPVKQNFDLSQQDVELLNLIYPAFETAVVDGKVFTDSEGDRAYLVLFVTS